MNDKRNHNHIQQDKIDGMYIYFNITTLKQQDINLSYTIFSKKVTLYEAVC